MIVNFIIHHILWNYLFIDKVFQQISRGTGFLGVRVYLYINKVILHLSNGLTVKSANLQI